MIIVCNSWQQGNSHEKFDSAFLAMLAKSYPQEGIVFYAERSHLRSVQTLLSQRDVEVRVEYRAARYYGSYRNGRRIFPGCVRMLWLIFREARRRKTGKIIFLDTYLTKEIIIIKFLLSLLSRQVKCLMLFHMALEVKLKCTKQLWPQNLFSLALSFFNRPNLRYLVLGESIQKELTKISLPISCASFFIDHPNLYNKIAVKGYQKKERIVFGAIGQDYHYKGSEKLFRLADKISKMKLQRKPEFRYVGQLLLEKRVEIFSLKTIVGVPFISESLSNDSYDKSVLQLDYILLLFNQDVYKLRASATFFDALVYNKPIIALNNVFVRHYFERFGDIGYLCQDLEEMKAVIIDVCNNPPLERYLNQKRNLLHASEMISIEKIAREFREKWC